jgi:hypothetical protein
MSVLASSAGCIVCEAGHGSADFFSSPLAVLTGNELMAMASRKISDATKTKLGERSCPKRGT